MDADRMCRIAEVGTPMRACIESIATNVGYVAQALNDWVQSHQSVTTMFGVAWNMDGGWAAQ